MSNVIASSLVLHAKTGGIIPEVAARDQISHIIPVISQALEQAGVPNGQDIDAIAITYGPGLIGSLLVGVETAKTLSFAWNKPLIPVNHLYGHIYANWIDTPSLRANENEHGNDILPEFPAIALIVSGGHTDLVLMKSHKETVWLGGTRDDAAGEAFDKIGRILGLEYPAGPMIEELAKSGNAKTYLLPRPLKYDKSFDFSFSGLKTAALREIQKFSPPTSQKSLTTQTISDIARDVQDAIIDVLVYKTMNAAKTYKVKSIILGGGVAANLTLREEFLVQCSLFKVKFFAPPKNLCVDNAAMIATAAVFQGAETPWEELTADPELYFD